MGETASRLMLYGLAGVVFSIDRFTKWIIETRLDRLDSHVVISGCSMVGSAAWDGVENGIGGGPARYVAR